MVGAEVRKVFEWLEFYLKTNYPDESFKNLGVISIFKKANYEIFIFV